MARKIAIEIYVDVQLVYKSSSSWQKVKYVEEKTTAEVKDKLTSIATVRLFWPTSGTFHFTLALTGTGSRNR